jgi:hypothetical protein
VIRLWDMISGKEIRPREASPASLKNVGFTADGKTILTLGTDSALSKWEAATGRFLGTPRQNGTAAAKAMRCGVRRDMLEETSEDSALDVFEFGFG